MAKSNNTIVAIINALMSWIFKPRILFGLSVSSSILLFAPEKYLEIILNNSYLAKYKNLNPWVGLSGLYVSILFVSFSLAEITSPIQDWWYEKKVIRQRKIHDPYSSI